MNECAALQLYRKHSTWVSLATTRHNHSSVNGSCTCPLSIEHTGDRNIVRPTVVGFQHPAKPLALELVQAIESMPLSYSALLGNAGASCTVRQCKLNRGRVDSQPASYTASHNGIACIIPISENASIRPAVCTHERCELRQHLVPQYDRRACEFGPERRASQLLPSPTECALAKTLTTAVGKSAFESNSCIRLAYVPDRDVASLGCATCCLSQHYLQGLGAPAATTSCIMERHSLHLVSNSGKVGREVRHDMRSIRHLRSYLDRFGYLV